MPNPVTVHSRSARTLLCATQAHRHTTLWRPVCCLALTLAFTRAHTVNYVFPSTFAYRPYSSVAHLNGDANAMVPLPRCLSCTPASGRGTYSRGMLRARSPFRRDSGLQLCEPVPAAEAAANAVDGNISDRSRGVVQDCGNLTARALFFSADKLDTAVRMCMRTVMTVVRAVLAILLSPFFAAVFVLRRLGLFVSSIVHPRKRDAGSSTSKRALPARGAPAQAAEASGARAAPQSQSQLAQELAEEGRRLAMQQMLERAAAAARGPKKPYLLLENKEAQAGALRGSRALNATLSAGLRANQTGAKPEQTGARPAASAWPVASPRAMSEAEVAPVIDPVGKVVKKAAAAPPPAN
eukprot:5221762-Pleurochrysis_carterae.AAC.4